MFTGIIERTSTVVDAKKQRGGLIVRVKTPRGWKLKRGESVSVNGVCSTVAGVAKNAFGVDYMPETISKTTVGAFTKGTIVNLEQSVTASTILGGHIVQGHIDGRGVVKDIARRGGSKVIRVGIPKTLARYFVPKGSVCVDGVSLTVVDVDKNWFTPLETGRPKAVACPVAPKDGIGVALPASRQARSSAGRFLTGFTVSLVAYTLTHTNLGYLKRGDKVNVEVDVLAKYLERLCKCH